MLIDKAPIHKVTFCVRLNEALVEAFIRDQHESVAGSLGEDRQHHERVIKRAGNYDLDRTELATYIAWRAGFRSSDGDTFSDFDDEL